MISHDVNLSCLKVTRTITSMSWLCMSVWHFHLRRNMSVRWECSCSCSIVLFPLWTEEQIKVWIENQLLPESLMKFKITDSKVLIWDAHFLTHIFNVKSHCMWFISVSSLSNKWMIEKGVAEYIVINWHLFYLELF